ncbi:Chagasin family peptidase inhibitor I42 [Singulisphaera sp. GP187]|uniref:C1 family peptidase n=1 Tax=Singulisphaera sp. GP187 TaxID=1882752 RepID=UPI00092C692D|nr:C1 family peptidase [Singulisphaera sp. GP187]SIO63182.1 Chagasin family peptidase inhibitor I42 [Singulisphaera sp. GP187]
MVKKAWLVGSAAALATLSLAWAAPQGNPGGNRTAQQSASEKDDLTYYQNREESAPAKVKASLKDLRGQTEKAQLTFTVGYTRAMDRPLDRLAGTREEDPQAEQKAAQDRKARYKEFSAETFRAWRPRAKGTEPKDKSREELTSLPRRWDWRQQGKVTPVRDQRGCGSDWAFSTVGALESAYLIRNGQTIDASEQHVVNCSGAGGCEGGYTSKALEYLTATGTATEADVPYTAEASPCNKSAPTPYKLQAWNWVSPADPARPTVDQLKDALFRYGPLNVAVIYSPLMQAYTTGVFNEQQTGSTNHTVVLVGWDDDKGAWIMRNSWGPDWGSKCDYGPERGYMYIKYGSNRIGAWAQWVVAKASDNLGGHLAAPEDNVVTLTSEQNGKSVNLEIGQTLTVRLKSQLGTGFSWQVVKNDKESLQQLGEPRTIQGDGADGGLEQQEFRFRGVKKQSVVLRLDYRRPFGPPPANPKSAEFTVKIK